jgi:dihydrofolate synthase / folylpolyglutamate synthase
MPTSYPQSVEFLYGLQKHGIKPGLEAIQALLDRLGRPERRYPSLHIGGTNGKGSTAAMTASMLQAAGYRVGLYTSPHLVDFRERILVNGAMIAEERVAALTGHIRALRGTPREPTFFEFTTAMAFQHFAESGVDVAVIEVGLGGRFDATNELAPVATAITNIALDHQEYLGGTLGEIAYEKAGIIKPGVPVVVGRASEEAMAVIARVAAERGAPLHRLHRDFRTAGESPAHFRYDGMRASYGGLACPLAGRHQLDNAACALALLEAASERGLPVPEGAVREGLRTVRWGGRLETVESRPQIVLDGAHNPDAAAVVADYLADARRQRPGSRVILILGMMRDKDREGFLDHLLPQVDEVVVTQAQGPRATPARELEASVKARGRAAHVSPDPADAMAFARRLAAPDDLILMTGSVMLVGETKAIRLGCGLSPLSLR